MTKKERIAELERRVAELEAAQSTVVWWTPEASWYTCSLCGTRYTGVHACWTYPYQGTGIYTGAGTDMTKVFNACAAPNYQAANITYIGAAS